MYFTCKPISQRSMPLVKLIILVSLENKVSLFWFRENYPIISGKMHLFQDNNSRFRENKWNELYHGKTEEIDCMNAWKETFAADLVAGVGPDPNGSVTSLFILITLQSVSWSVLRRNLWENQLGADSSSFQLRWLLEKFADLPVFAISI